MRRTRKVGLGFYINIKYHGRVSETRRGALELNPDLAEGNVIKAFLYRQVPRLFRLRLSLTL